MTDIGFDYGTPEDASTISVSGQLVHGMCSEPSYPDDNYKTTVICEDGIDSVYLDALSIEGKERGEDTCKYFCCP